MRLVNARLGFRGSSLILQGGEQKTAILGKLFNKIPNWHLEFHIRKEYGKSITTAFVIDNPPISLLNMTGSVIQSALYPTLAATESEEETASTTRRLLLRQL